MKATKSVAAALAGSVCVIAFATPAAAQAQSFRIPPGDMKNALDAFVRQSGVEVVYRIDQLGVARSPGANGIMSTEMALRMLLAGSGLQSKRDASGAIAIIPAKPSSKTAAYRKSNPTVYYAQQEPAAVSAPATARSDQLDEIIVTARRRDESLIDVPVAVSAVSANDLNRKGVTDIQRAAKLVPQVIMTETPSGAGASFSIRGLGTSFGDPGLEQSVLVMLDGTPITRGRVVLMGMFDMAQIEVLKGPQSLFFGKNSPAGVLSVTSAGPSDTLEGYVRAGYEFEAREKYLEAAVSGPISDTFGARLAVRASDMAGWLHNVAVSRPSPLPLASATYFPVSAEPGSSRLPGTREIMGRLTLKWEPTADFDATLKLTLGDRKDKGFVNQQWCDPAVHNGPVSVGGIQDTTDGCEFDDKTLLNAVPPQYISPDWEGMHEDGEPFGRLKSILSNLTLNYSLDDITLTSVSSYWKIKYASVGGYDYTSYGLASSAIGETTDSFSQELRMVTDFDAPVNMTLGGFYEKIDRQNYTDSLLFFVGPVPAGQPGAGRYDSFNSQNYAKAETISAFGQIRWAITEQLELAGGVRYTKETRTQRIFNTYVHPRVQPALGPFVPVGGEFTGKFRDTNWSPEITLSYKPAQDVMVYAAYKTGYKSGGFPSLSLFKLKPDLTIPQSSDFAFGPERAKGGELGFKAQLFDRKLRVEATAYLYDYDDLQQSIFNPSTFSFSVLNAASARIKGIELQTEWAVTSELRINASAAYNSAKFKSFPNSPCYTGQTPAGGCVGGAQDLAGRTLPRAPKWNLIAGVNYDRSLTDDLMIGLSGDVSYRSKYILQETQPPYAVQRGFALWNAGVRFYTSDNHYELAFIGRNLADKHYAEFSSNATFAQAQDQLHGGTPRGRELRVQGTFRF